MPPNSPIHLEAQAVADEFNAKLGVSILRVDSSVLPVLHPDQLRKLEDLKGWVTVRALFEHVFLRRATPGELIILGRQLRKLYPRQVRGSNTAFYFVAPAGTSVPESH